MTAFEQWSLVAYFLQLSAILWGIWIMRASTKSREPIIEALRQQGAALERMGAGITRLLERSAK